MRYIVSEGFYFYIVRCADGSYYRGHTDNLEQRIIDHNESKYQGYTSSRLPAKLVYYELFCTRDEAFVAEHKIKRWSRKKKEILIRDGWAGFIKKESGRMDSTSLALRSPRAVVETDLTQVTLQPTEYDGTRGIEIMPSIKKSGFMLFEIMLVIALILVCSTIGFVSYARFKGTSITTDVAILGLLLRTAATRATCLKKEQKMNIDELNSRVIYDGASYALQEGYSFGVLPHVYGPPSAPHKLVTQAVTFVDKKIVAHPDGTLQSGTLYITDSQEQYALTTPVSAFSYIRVYRYRDGVWQSY